MVTSTIQNILSQNVRMIFGSTLILFTVQNDDKVGDRRALQIQLNVNLLMNHFMDVFSIKYIIFNTCHLA
jgi:hypothetical protein